MLPQTLKRRRVDAFRSARPLCPPQKLYGLAMPALQNSNHGHMHARVQLAETHCTHRPICINAATSAAPSAADARRASDCGMAITVHLCGSDVRNPHRPLFAARLWRMNHPVVGLAIWTAFLAATTNGCPSTRCAADWHRDPTFLLTDLQDDVPPPAAPGVCGAAPSQCVC